MKRYDVTLPVVGQVVVTVEAEDEESAIEAALGLDPFPINADGVNGAEIIELNTVRRVVTSNVLHAPLNEAEATEAL